MKNENYNKGRELCLSKKYSYPPAGVFDSPNMTAYKDTFPQYNNVNGLATTPEWRDFMDGWNSVYHDKQEAKRKQYCVDDFLTELRTLCKKYDVSIVTDGGYDSGRAFIKDYEFHIEIL
jgi:hypothetical protein